MGRHEFNNRLGITLGLIFTAFLSQGCNQVIFGGEAFKAASTKQTVSTSSTPCTFNNQTIPDGNSVTAYLFPSTVGGVACQSESRLCTNGTLSGSFNYATCTPTGGSSCIFNGHVVPDGTSVQAYQNSSGTQCNSEFRTCNNGTLSGSFTSSSCDQDDGNGDGSGNGDGDGNTNNNGSGATNCSFNGSALVNNQSVTAYFSSSVPYGSNCLSETRTCSTGALSGSYAYAGCSVGAPNSCLFNGITVAHGASVTAYPSANVAYGQSCTSQTRTCNNGVLSGSYISNSCSVQAPASCTFNGTTIAHEGSVTAYAFSAVAFGQACQEETRTCRNGVLSGNLPFANCSVGQQPQSCLFNGVAIAHGASVTAYAESNPAWGGSCASQTRICNDGTLSGSYAAASCTQMACAPNSIASCDNVENGAATTQCNSQGTGWGACVYSCSQGYQLYNNRCYVPQCQTGEHRECFLDLTTEFSVYFEMYPQDCGPDGQWTPIYQSHYIERSSCNPNRAVYSIETAPGY